MVLGAFFLFELQGKFVSNHGVEEVAYDWIGCIRVSSRTMNKNIVFVIISAMMTSIWLVNWDCYKHLLDPVNKGAIIITLYMQQTLCYTVAFVACIFYC